jgi:lipopolysaccharide/colanic/teichoic acid biosynthesis glycosyltransferase
MGASRQAEQVAYQICSEQAFVEAIRSERVRCDRTGQTFSVVAFKSASRDCPAPFLADKLSSRLRLCDRVGLLGDGEIAIILPATSRTGAERFAADMTRILNGMLESSSWRVSTYPNDCSCAGRRESEITDYSPLDDAIAPLCSPRLPRWKRYLDVFGAVAGLVLFAPLFVIIPLYIKTVSRGPVFYRQQRLGYRGRPFTFLKFRTMKHGNDSSAHREYLASLIKGEQAMTKLDTDPVRRDPRVIPGGNTLRKLALDEIPQFLNILKGDMSLVGPRPCIPYEAAEYARWHTQRFDVLPGLTGLWQVSGKNKLSFAEMVRLDNTYARTMSLWLDVKILLLTFPALFLMAAEAAVTRLAPRSGKAGGR